MSRCRTLIAVLVVLIIATALAAVAAPQRAEATTVKGQLRHAKLALVKSRARLQAAEAALAAAVAADPTIASVALAASAAPPAPAPSASPCAPTVDQLKSRVVKARRVVRKWQVRVRGLMKEFRLERKITGWERGAEWMPIIKVAAARYHVSAPGMYRMMMRESGGQRMAGASSAFKGLFQYYTGTWASSWNPWRGESIYDGSSQIFATAYAIHKGMGPSMWTTTFASQY